jgi:hypothetical protein
MRYHQRRRYVLACGKDHDARTNAWHGVLPTVIGIDVTAGSGSTGLAESARDIADGSVAAPSGQVPPTGATETDSLRIQRPP